MGAELAVDDEDRLIRAIRDGAQDTINDAGQQIIRRQLQVAPTLTIRPGFPVRVIVTGDLVLNPMEQRNDQTEARPDRRGQAGEDNPDLPRLHRDLSAYAEALGRESGQPIIDPKKLIVPMLERFMATDRGFAKARRNRE